LQVTYKLLTEDVNKVVSVSAYKKFQRQLSLFISIRQFSYNEVTFFLLISVDKVVSVSAYKKFQ